MALAATIEGDRHAAQNEGPRFHQSMRVVTNTDAQHTEKQTLSFVLCTCALYLAVWAAGSDGFTPRSPISNFRIQISERKAQGQRLFSNASASARSSRVVILIFLALPSTTITAIPICSTSRLSSVTSRPAASSSPRFA